MRARALELLEFTTVRQRLAGHASSALGADLARALAPSTDAAEIERLGLETAEGRQAFNEGVDMDFSGAADVRGFLERAEKGGMLTGPDLRAVQAALTATQKARETFSRRRDARPLLAGIATGIPDLGHLVDGIGQAIGAHGEALDGASPLLRELRSEVRIAYQRLEETLQRIVRSSLGRRVLQEPIVTERNGRLVLPVRSSERSHIPGLVHDTSESGQTLFVEPLGVVAAGNRLQELRAASAREEERVLRALSARVGERAQQASAALEATAYLDLICAKARYGASLRALASPVPMSQDMTLRLVEARHPLLKGDVVPLSIAVGPSAALARGFAAANGQRPGSGWTVLLVTGPNAGGKTVALKTVGLMALMHQSGLQLPVENGTVLPAFDAVYADIGDQQSILQSLSSFTAHIAGLQAILASASSRSLVLLDELGASTDPEEGTALGKAVLERLLEERIATIATTHYRDLAAFAQDRAGMMNACVELDTATLAPTYRLTVGMPGRSYALAIAARMGLDVAVLERARVLLPVSAKQMETMLEELQREQVAVAALKRQAEDALREANAARTAVEARLATVEQEREALLEEARREIQARAAALRAEVEEAERSLRAAQAAAVGGAFSPALAAARERAAQVRQETRAPEWQALVRPGAQEWLRALKLGDPVRVQGFHVEGKVLSLPDEKGSLLVQVGALQVAVPVEQISPPQAPPQTTKYDKGFAEPERRASSGFRSKDWDAPSRRPQAELARLQQEHPADDELDLHGMRAEEALERLDDFLDRALLQGHSEVRIVHGVGTGALRQAVRQHLSRHPAVRSWVPGEERQALGTTWVVLT
jgi:DNA mismatch repair protein MutS2